MANTDDNATHKPYMLLASAYIRIEVINNDIKKHDNSDWLLEMIRSSYHRSKENRGFQETTGCFPQNKLFLGFQVVPGL